MIILASGSPRRRELLASIFDEYEIIKSEKDEVVTKSLPADIVNELSLQKAEEVWDKVTGENILRDDNNLLLAADTLVFLNGKRMGKPSDKDDAVRMLKELSGNTHEVYTSVSLFWGNGEKVEKTTFCQSTKVSFYAIDEKDIVDYVESGEPMDKAGAYAIQGSFAKHIKGIEGEYANVVGLPIARLYQEIKKIGGFVNV